VVRGIVPPVPGLLALEVWARGSKRSPARLVAVRRRLGAKEDRRTAVRARLTRAGRRLLRSGRPLVLEIELTMTAQADKLVSKADGVLRLTRSP
jgi:DNA-binding transcriptional LysR family regulator